ncbi:RNA-directed DNA polymerase, eukaryota [Tanacetum coccineum]
MQKQFQVGVSKTKAFRAKAKAEGQLRGDQEQQYGLLWDYCDALKKANPNTTVKIDVYRAHNPHDNVRRFKRIYVCLGALKDGFRASGRQLLGLDGAFMKGNYPGQLLTVVSVDANNGIYHVAYGIVESESKESWTWFLSCLGEDLDMQENLNFTFIIDRQKVHTLVILEQITIFRQLLEARDSPVITALEYVREYLMKRIVIVQKVIEKSQGPLTPTVTKIFNAIKEKASQCVVVWNGADLFQEVSGFTCSMLVACIFYMTDNGNASQILGLPVDWGSISHEGHNKRSCKGPSASASASQPARASASGSTSGPRSGSQPASQPVRVSASASASQPARAPSASASASQPARAPSASASEVNCKGIFGEWDLKCQDLVSTCKGHRTSHCKGYMLVHLHF